MKIIDAVRAMRGAQAVGFTAITIPKLVKSKMAVAGIAPDAVIHKHSNVRGMVNFDYEHSKQKQDIRNGGNGEVSIGKTWGEHDTAAIVEHNGRAYLQVMLQDSKSTYTMNGVEIDGEIVKSCMAERKPGNGLKVCRYLIDNIVELRHGGQVYRKEQ